jgi:hypothetical protein
MRKKIKLPEFKKEIKDFLLSEEGKITKKDIVKMGMSLAVLSMIFTPSQAIAQPHTSYFYSGNQPGAPTPQGGHVSHSSHGSHGSHGNY